MTNIDTKYMKMCLKLAKRGAGRVAPNPMVGCVVLDKSGKVVSKGYHKKYGENHAERDALLKLQNNIMEKLGVGLWWKAFRSTAASAHSAEFRRNW